MADRRQLLDRLQIALANPDVDGVLASPDIMDDLLSVAPSRASCSSAR